MKIVITGCSGMLGNDLCRVLEEHELFCLDIVEPDFQLPTSNFQLCDITDFEKTYRTITKINPEIVIHTAAWTDVDVAEEKQEECYKINLLGTRNVALSCQRFDTVMVYISTDYVFDGEKKEPYNEFDEPNPLSVYGKSKYFGEIVVQQLLNKFFIIRSSWLFGRSGKNFVKTILNLAKEKKELKIVNDQFGSPTYTKDLAEAIMLLVTRYSDTEATDFVGAKVSATGLYGTYHITNSGSCSWYEFAKEIIKEIRDKRLEIRVKPIITEEIKRPAERPKNSVLENFIWKLNGFKPLRNWKDALKDYIDAIKGAE